MLAIFADYFSGSWYIYLVFGLVQAAGVLGLLALLTDASRPTVGQALGFGLKALVPYIIAQILLGLIMLGVPILLIGLGAAINPGLAALLSIVSLVLLAYIWIKFSLLSPVIAIDKVMNPIAALAQSWRLTKGNSLRIFAFFMLLIVSVLVLSLIAGMVFTLFSLLGDEIGFFASAVGNGLVSMAFTTVMLAVLVAIHRQMSGKSVDGVRETFE